MKLLIHFQTLTVEVWEWMTNSIPHFTTDNYLSMSAKGTPEVSLNDMDKKSSPHIKAEQNQDK